MANMSSKTAWETEFGNDYHARNLWVDLKQRTRLWARILGDIEPSSILEVGAGTGTNLIALSHLTNARLMAVEPNDIARKQIPYDIVGTVGPSTADNLPFMDEAAELVFTSGVLIHIPPDELGAAMAEIYRVSSRYIACVEYFSDELEAKTYRGENGLLWKQDFGKLWLDNYPNLSVVNYGFAWRGATGLSNLTFWIFSKGETNG